MKDDLDLELPDDVVGAVVEDGQLLHARGVGQTRDTEASTRTSASSREPTTHNPPSRLPARKGGFLADQREEDRAEATTTIKAAPERILSRTNGHSHGLSPPVALLIKFPLEANEQCRHCKSIELDETLRVHFGVNVCESCRRSHDQEYYQLITKTTAREEFLLTDEELADGQRLPHMTKPNPHKSTWSDMHLYLLGDVRRFALDKWGSLEALREELEKRALTREAKKERKFREKLAGTHDGTVHFILLL